jgi:hypothetical protein
MEELNLKFETIAVDGIPNRRTAIAIHTRLRENSCSPFELGRFYRYLLHRQLWNSQGELAKDLGASTASVSRALAINTVPDEIIRVAGGQTRITYRLAKGIIDLIEILGAEIVVRNAARLAFDPLRSKYDLLTALATGPESAASARPVKLSLDHSGRFIRLKSPYLDDMVRSLSMIEGLFNLLIQAHPMTKERSAQTDTAKAVLDAKRKDAIATHADLNTKANLAELGRFYLAMFEQRVWNSRLAMAADLGISRGMIDRRMALASVPDEVTAAFGGSEFMSSRTVKAVESVIASIGTEQIKANAAKIPFEAKRSAATTLTLLATGPSPS